MSKITLTVFPLLSLLFLGNNPGNYAAQSNEKTAESQPTRRLDEGVTGYVSKNDCRKRQRHDGSRSQPVERN